jgi:holin-like protein
MNKNIFSNIFQIMRSALILLAFLYFGKWLQQISHLPISGSIFGFLLLFITLNLRFIPVRYFLLTGNFLIDYITLFFVSISLGLLQYSGVLSIL